MLTLLCSVGAGPRAGADEVVGPFYEEKSKSYFELRRMPDRIRAPDRHGFPWTQANDYVRRLQYQGIRGRLAVIDSPEKHRFIEAQLLSNADTWTDGIWIGLRIFCGGMQQLWTDGHIQRRTDFSVWHRQWYSGEAVKCGINKSRGYMPVAYTKGEKTFRWLAVGTQKGYNWMIVEYPTLEKKNRALGDQ